MDNLYTFDGSSVEYRWYDFSGRSIEYDSDGEECYSNFRNVTNRKTIFLNKNRSEVCTINVISNSMESNSMFEIEFENNTYEKEKIDVTLFFDKDKESKYYFFHMSCRSNSNCVKSMFYCEIPFALDNLYSVKLSFSLKKKLLESIMIKEMLNKENSDLKILTNDEKFNVHKCILSYKSNVLKAMINSEMSEKNKGEINFKDWDSLTVKELIEYIYTNDCDVEKFPHNLFRLAHYLDMKDLQDKCEKYLLHHINVDNIVNTLELAMEKQFDLSQLKQIAVDHVKFDYLVFSESAEYLEFLETLLDNIIKNNNGVIDDTESKFFLTIMEFLNNCKINHLMVKAMLIFKKNYDQFSRFDKYQSILLNNPKLLMTLMDCAMKNNNSDDSIITNDSVNNQKNYKLRSLRKKPYEK